jgi:Ca-activated chloride channel family protein
MDTYAYRQYYRRPPPRPRSRVADPLKRFFGALWRFLWPLLLSLVILGLVYLVVANYAAAHGEGLKFHNPWAFFFLFGMPLVLLNDIYLRGRVSARMTFTRIDVLKSLPGRTRAKLLIYLPGILRAAVVGLVALAVARPQATAIREEADVEGIDIVMTLDMSNSMKAADIKPMRLEAAKAVIDDFVGRRVNDRIGVVVFGREAMTLVPLTLDYGVVRNLVKSLQLGAIDGKGTAIGNALGTALNRLRGSHAETKVIVLLTDGANNQGNVSPQQAAEFARTLGVKIYTILAGKQDETPVEVDTDFFGRSIFGKAIFPVNPELLKEISEETGGKFYTATDRKSLEDSFHSILDALEKTRISDVGVVYAETFPRFLIPALLLLLLEILFRFTISRKSP